MKKINLLFALLLMSGVVIAQTEEKNEVKIPTVQQEIPEEANKGVEINNRATTLNGGKNKGISISSAARKSSLMNGRAIKGAEMSEKEKGKSKDARSMKSTQSGKPADPGRPATVVPTAKPSAPVVRPKGRAKVKPKHPTGPPHGKPKGGPPKGKPPGGI